MSTFKPVLGLIIILIIGGSLVTNGAGGTWKNIQTSARWATPVAHLLQTKGGEILKSAPMHFQRLLGK
jgi:hypothetical protein